MGEHGTPRPKAAVRGVVDHLPGNPFVFRTDVKSDYASIDHDVLMGQLRERVDDVRVLNLLEQYVRRTVYADGVYTDAMRGISLECPLSPLMGILYLAVLDERMEETGMFYARFPPYGARAAWTTGWCWPPRGGSCARRSRSCGRR